MEKINVLIITIVFCTAIILAIFVMRKSRIQHYKKYGFLMTLLLFALGLSGCYTIPLQNLQKQSSDIPVDKNIREKSDRMAKLSLTDAWQKFKNLWKKLDRLEPGKKISPETSGAGKLFGEYSGTIDRDAANVLATELNDAVKNLQALPDKNLISEKEINLLNELGRERINYMSRGLSSMVTRMAPSYFSVHRDESLKDLERKIDVLLALKAGKTVSKKEFDSAIANIQKDIENYAVLNAISDNGYFPLSFYNYGNKIDIQSIEKYVDMLAQSYAEYEEAMRSKNTEQDMKNKEFMEQRYKKTGEAVKETIKTLPSLKELIADLEN